MSNIATKTAKAFAIAAALLVLPASSAFAQAGAYGVSSNVSVMGLNPGSGFDYSNALPLDVYELREMDPAGVTMGTKPENTVYADAMARGISQPGSLLLETDATASHLSATYLPNSFPYGAGELRSWDTFTVTSATLPVNTPVTLVFRSDLAVEIVGSGIYGGSFYATHTVAGKSVALQQTFGDQKPAFVTDLGLITVSTKVGARITTSGRLNLATNSSYCATRNGVRICDGTVKGSALLELALDSASADAYLVADSGAVYHPAN